MEFKLSSNKEIKNFAVTSAFPHNNSSTQNQKKNNWFAGIGEPKNRL